MSDILHVPPVSEWTFGHATELTQEDLEVAMWLREQIEALCSHSCPSWTRNWGTARGTKHIVFGYGGIVLESEVNTPVALSAQCVAQGVLNHVIAYRNTVFGSVDLVWRREPEIERFGDLVRMSVRLCFEPSLVQVAKGVWVEARMAQLDPNGTWGRYHG